MSAQLRKYATQCTIYFPLIKASSQNFAVSGDYTHASGDVKISKDGGAAATATNSPSAITMGNGAIWSLTLTATEMSAAEIVVTIIDAATKAVEDQMIKLHTFGHASAKIVADLSAANLAADVQTIKTQSVTCAASVTVSPYVGSTGAAVNGTTVNTLASHDPGATLGTSTYAGADTSGTTTLLTRLSAARAGHLDSVILAANANQRTVSVTGSQHIAADIHELQAGVISAGDFAAGAIDAAALASDAATEIATAVAAIDIDGKTIQAALRIIAAVVAGKISGAGTSTEVFVGLDGATTRATVTADASGNRSAVTYV